LILSVIIQNSKFHALLTHNRKRTRAGRKREIRAQKCVCLEIVSKLQEERSERLAADAVVNALVLSGKIALPNCLSITSKLVSQRRDE